MERSSGSWRFPLAIVLTLANLGLVGANLNKHEVFPFNGTGIEEKVLGDATPSTAIEEVAGPNTSLTPVQAPTEETVADVDDWPGGRGPVPEGAPQARRVALAADRTAQITGSAPSWATASQLASYVAANFGVDPTAVDNQLTWHPEAATEVQSGNVLIEQAATFALGQSDLDPASLPTLDLVAELLRNRQSLFVVVIGHTDNLGDEQLNAELAFTRAQTVVDYLVGAGVIPGQLVVAAAGEDAPVASNDTEEGRQFNRRIELQFKNFLVAPGRIG